MPTSPDLPTGLLRPALAGVDPYEPGRPVEDVQRELGLESVVKLASNEGPFPPMPGAIAAIAAAAGGQRCYPDPGAWALRDALAARLGVGAERILPGNGVDSLIKLLCLAVLDPGDELVMGWPSFLSWRQGALMMGAAWRGVPLGPDGAYDLDALAAAVGPRTKLCVMVSPNNPTGAAVAKGDLDRLLDALPPHVLPVLDEAYFEYLPEGGHDGAALVRAGRPLVVMRTFSKAYGLAGLRVGYLLGPAGLVRALHRVRNAFDVNGVAQAAALASLEEADEHLPPRIALCRAERTRMADGLRALGLDPLPSEANFLLVEVGEDRAPLINRALLERGVIVRPARAFGAPGGIRITVGLPEETDRLLAAMAGALAG
ncbi:MAG: histidinol-phosphate transaminase [Thermoleophilia bacterium]|nr:histidinol-phosphate transaminase [Thermoleophilia bacterium]